MLGEDQEFAATVLEFGELCFAKALLECGELRVARAFSDAARLLGDFLEFDDFATELVKFEGGGVFVQQLVSRLVVEVIFFLFRVGQPLDLTSFDADSELGILP